MKALILVLLFFCVAAVAAPYNYVHADYSYSTLGGITTLTVKLHNNGAKNASCVVSVFNRQKSATVPAYGDSKVSFDSLPAGAQPRYACSSAE
jgi:hypothetical protein